MFQTKPKQDLSHTVNIDKIIENELLADCKFIVGPDNETAKPIHGHKIIFAMASPVFERMFSGNYAEAQTNSEIRINDAHPEDFINFRSLIYKNCLSNSANLSIERFINLYRLGDKYMVSSILTYCKDYISIRKYSLGSDLVTLFEFARELVDQTLLEAFKKYMSNSKQHPLDDKLNNLTQEAFYDYMQFVWKLKYSAIFIFSATSSYFAKNNLLVLLNMEDDKPGAPITGSIPNEPVINKTRNLLKNILKLIDFGKMSIRNFQNGPGKSDLLTSKQKYFIISALLYKHNCSKNCLTVDKYDSTYPIYIKN